MLLFGVLTVFHEITSETQKGIVINFTVHPKTIFLELYFK